MSKQKRDWYFRVLNPGEIWVCNYRPNASSHTAEAVVGIQRIERDGTLRSSPDWHYCASCFKETIEVFKDGVRKGYESMDDLVAAEEMLAYINRFNAIDMTVMELRKLLAGS